MSNQSLMYFYPMLAMFALTFAVMLRNVQVRVRSVLRSELTNEYFELFEGARPSDVVIKTGNHLRNLFEFPVLFYVAMLAAASLGRTGGLLAVLAWCYVALRAGHTVVHLTFNKVPARFAFFFTSNLVLAALWILVATGP